MHDIDHPWRSLWEVNQNVHFGRMLKISLMLWLDQIAEQLFGFLFVLIVISQWVVNKANVLETGWVAIEVERDGERSFWIVPQYEMRQFIILLYGLDNKLVFKGRDILFHEQLGNVDLLIHLFNF